MRRSVRICCFIAAFSVWLCAFFLVGGREGTFFDDFFLLLLCA